MRWFVSWFAARQRVAPYDNSERRLDVATRALRSFVYDWDAQTGDTWRGGAFTDITGYRPDEASPQRGWWADRIHPDDRESLARTRSAAVARGDESFTGEYRFQHHDGHYVWVWEHSVAFRDAKGNLLRVVGTVRDLTARKAAERSLVESERRFKAALTATSEILWTNNAAGEMLGEQIGWAAYTGQTLAQYQRYGWSAAIHPDDAAATIAAWRDAVTRGDIFMFEHRVRSYDGEYRRFAVRAVPIRDLSGEVTEWVGVHRDITEQQRTETALRETTQRLELAMAAADIGMWDWDVEGNKMVWNRQCHEITGITPEGFDGDPRTFSALIVGDNVDHDRDLFAELKSPSPPPRLEFQFRRPNGSLRWAVCEIVMIRDAAGRAVRGVGTLTDVTDRKQRDLQQQALLDAERAARASIESAAQVKDEFLATISHELRTPLNAILGWTTLMQRANASPKTLSDGLKIIERNGKMQAQLINDLFDANRLMSGKFDFDMQPLNPNDVVRAAADSLLPAFVAKRVRLNLQVQSEELIVNADPRRLQQVVWNLLANAVKFSPEDSTVDLSTRGEADNVVIEVKDAGEGISSEFLPHVFDRFRQGDNTLARRHGGLGLGLAISKQIVGFLGATLTAASDGVGCGATFRISLPVAAGTLIVQGNSAESGRYAALSMTNNYLRGLRILAVEDKPEALEFLARILSEHGAEVAAVGSAQDALAQLCSLDARVDLLVSDIGMAAMSGYELIARIRADLKRGPDALPAIALTAFARDEDRDAALRAGFQLHLVKPYQVTDLMRAIRSLRPAS